MRKIRILHIIKTLNLGGAEANLFNLVPAIDPDRFEIHVAYSSGGELEGKFRESRIRLFKYAEGDHKIKSFASLIIVLRLARYILKNRIRIVQTHSFNAHVWGILASKLTGAKVIEHVHDFRYLDPAEYKRRRGMTRQYQYTGYFKKMSDRVIVLTRQNYDFLLENKFYNRDQVVKIPNGINVAGAASTSAEKKALLRRKFGIGTSEAVVLTSCRIAAEKNIDLIFRIAPRVKKGYDKVVFIISGNGPLLGEFEAKVRGQGLEDLIRMIGFYPHTNELLSISDLFLLPSFLELHSIAILEAMRERVPTLVSKDVGCNNEFIIPWENGVLLDPFSDEGWLDAVINLLKDNELRKRIGEAGYRNCVENFNIRHVAEKIETIYRDLADGQA